MTDRPKPSHKKQEKTKKPAPEAAKTPAKKKIVAAEAAEAVRRAQAAPPAPPASAPSAIRPASRHVAEAADSVRRAQTAKPASPPAAKATPAASPAAPKPASRAVAKATLAASQAPKLATHTRPPRRPRPPRSRPSRNPRIPVNSRESTEACVGQAQAAAYPDRANLSSQDAEACSGRKSCFNRDRFPITDRRSSRGLRRSQASRNPRGPLGRSGQCSRGRCRDAAAIVQGRRPRLRRGQPQAARYRAGQPRLGAGPCQEPRLGAQPARSRAAAMGLFQRAPAGLREPGRGAPRALERVPRRDERAVPRASGPQARSLQLGNGSAERAFRLSGDCGFRKRGRPCEVPRRVHGVHEPFPRAFQSIAWCGVRGGAQWMNPHSRPSGPWLGSRATNSIP